MTPPLRCARCKRFLSRANRDLTGESIDDLLRGGETPVLDCPRCGEPTGAEVVPPWVVPPL